MKTLIPCVQDVTDPIVEEMAELGLIENVIEVLKGCNDGPVRKIPRLCWLDCVGIRSLIQKFVHYGESKY